MGHHAGHIACIIEDACDVARRSIHLFGIAESHAAFTLQPIKRCFVRDIVAIVMGYGECYLFTGIITATMMPEQVTFPVAHHDGNRSEEHTSELQSLMRISYAVFCLKNKNKK